MSYRSDRFNRGLRPLGDLPHSDCGRSVDLLLESLDFDWTHYLRDERKRARDASLKLDILIAVLLLCKLDHLVPTLRIIVRNGKFNDESVAEMVGGKHGKKALKAARRQYERHRKSLLEIV